MGLSFATVWFSTGSVCSLLDYISAKTGPFHQRAHEITARAQLSQLSVHVCGVELEWLTT